MVLVDMIFLYYIMNYVNILKNYITQWTTIFQITNAVVYQIMHDERSIQNANIPIYFNVTEYKKINISDFILWLLRNDHLLSLGAISKK